MKCFNHIAKDAVTLCKICNKGLCHDCTHDVERSAVCSEKCLTESKDRQQITDHTKKIYGITGDKAYRVPAVPILIALIGILFLSDTIYKNIHFGFDLDYFVFAMGIVFIFVGGAVYYRNKTLGINY